MKRLSQLIFMMTGYIHNVTHAAPFGAGKVKITTDDNTEEAEEESLRYAVRGAAAAISNESPYLNKVVEEFFANDGSSSDIKNVITQSEALGDEIKMLANADSLKSFLTSVRRKLHRQPEVMYQESFTSKTIQSILSELNIKYTTGWSKNTHQDVYPGEGGYGIVADIGTGASPCLILRADMDALPIDERTEDISSFKSRTRGKMHACGHDGHVTMLLGAAAVLKGMEQSLKGTVRIMFQPAEEGGAGAKRMVEEGVIDQVPKAELAFGMHVWPMLPSGTIASRSGTIMGAAETFEIVINGKGGHAAMPHLTIDPVVAAASMIMNLQPIISRTISPLESGVISVTQVAAGDAFNVIPSSAVVKGTIRAFNPKLLMSLRDRLEHVLNTTSTMYGCNSTVKYSPDFYVNVHNDEKLYDTFSKAVAGPVSKEKYVRDFEPTMGGEDFAFLSAAVPSTFFMIGQGTGGDVKQHVPPTDYGLHHPNFALDESILPIGVELHANLAIRGLKWLEMKFHTDDNTATEL
eukprot:CAMPEP_0172515672 /NCGR_PEP_ID=MMETSP1066-20121228/269783_1 /TAXON_ID=671091 /ORGANISM="Coscinodiscus wailesii, Strain CCMP2513" /LENGTH=520 /DNA_ID=CAMNT_0013296809 /DNA_START=129 /DNA_END=1691 /DNA_ORIENTATION=-